MGSDQRRQHTVYVDAKVWDEAKRRADDQFGAREGVSAFLRQALDWYTEQPGARMPRRPRHITPAPEDEDELESPHAVAS